MQRLDGKLWFARGTRRALVREYGASIERPTEL
jgi:hypothetical protein